MLYVEIKKKHAYFICLKAICYVKYDNAYPVVLSLYISTRHHFLSVYSHL